MRQRSPRLLSPSTGASVMPTADLTGAQSPAVARLRSREAGRRHERTQRPSGSAYLSSAQQTPAATAAIVRLVGETAGCSTVGATATAILRVVAEVAAADQGSLALLSEGQLETIAVFPTRLPEARSRFPVGFGVAGWVAAVGDPAEIADVRHDRRYVALPYPETRAFVSVPLGVPEGSPAGGTVTPRSSSPGQRDLEQELVGVLSLGAWRPGAFPEGTAEMLRPIAQAAAVLLRRAESAEVLSARVRELEQQTRTTLAEVLHDLKGPVQSVAGFLHIVGQEQVGELNEQQREFLGLARRECERLMGALAERIQHGGGTAEASAQWSPISPARVAADAVERERGQALARGVRLELRAAAALPEVRADVAAVRGALASLLQNAVRFSTAGSRVRATVTADGGWVCFGVSDEGPGFSPEDLERVFERGYQGRSGRETGTAGLGLWSARRAVEQAGGSIWASNRPQRGATVRFALPAATPEV